MISMMTIVDSCKRGESDGLGDEQAIRMLREARCFLESTDGLPGSR